MDGLRREAHRIGDVRLSSIYKVEGGGMRLPTKSWAFVPKNAKVKGKGKRVNVHVHAFEMAHMSMPEDPLLSLLGA